MGWLVPWWGDIDAQQAELAIRFYQSVTDQVQEYSTNFRNNGIVLTGHSLGGGLAGFIGAIYANKADVFDNMPFEKAANNTYTSTNTNLKDLVYPGFDQAPIFSKIEAASVQGEILKNFRGLQDTYDRVLKLGISPEGNDNDINLGPVDKHSMSLLVTRLYFSDQDGSDTPGQWGAAAKYFWPVLYDNAFANNMGLNTIQGRYSAADKLNTIIAYSAIDDGPTPESMPFGNTAIRALYNDANDFGRALSLKDVNNVSITSSALTRYAPWIAEAFVQYAGELALLKVLDSNNLLVKQGVLTYTATPSPNNNGTYGNQALEIDFSHYKWFDSLNAIPSMVARNDLVSHILKDMGNGDSTSIIAKMTQIWGGDIDIGRVIFTLTNSYGATSATDSYSSEANLFVTGDQSQLTCSQSLVQI